MRRMNRKFDYQASSPDEKALVEGCAKVGFIFTGEINSTLNIRLQSQRVSKMHFRFFKLTFPTPLVN